MLRWRRWRVFAIDDPPPLPKIPANPPYKVVVPDHRQLMLEESGEGAGVDERIFGCGAGWQSSFTAVVPSDRVGWSDAQHVRDSRCVLAKRGVEIIRVVHRPRREGDGRFEPWRASSMIVSSYGLGVATQLTDEIRAMLDASRVVDFLVLPFALGQLVHWFLLILSCTMPTALAIRVSA